jgi:MOSC domain-containing protein YiiM
MGKSISTGIFKEPTGDTVHVTFTNLAGDRQADLTVHGGVDKAVYAYAAEHYSSWKRELGRNELPWGMFGENLTVEGGLYEDNVMIGDRYRIGTAEVVAVQPRLPCFKLGIRFGTQRIVKQFAKSGRFGVYFRVVLEGDVRAGDDVTKLTGTPEDVSIGDIGRLLTGQTQDHQLIQRASRSGILPERIRSHIASLLS